jgi:hypothetical protein
VRGWKICRDDYFAEAYAGTAGMAAEIVVEIVALVAVGKEKVVVVGGIAVCGFGPAAGAVPGVELGRTGSQMEIVLFGSPLAELAAVWAVSGKDHFVAAAEWWRTGLVVGIAAVGETRTVQVECQKD